MKSNNTAIGKSLGAWVAAAVVAAWCATAKAEVVTPVAVTKVDVNPTTYGPVTHLIDGSGLSGVGPVQLQLANMRADTGEFIEGELIGSYPTPSVRFDLGAVYTLTGMYVWNSAGATYSQTVGPPHPLVGDFSTRGVKDLRVFADPTTTKPGTFESFVLARSTVPATVSSTANINGSVGWGLDYAIPAQTLTFGTPVTARYVWFDWLSDFDAPGGFQGLSEVRFEAIPEPSAILLLGVGGLILWRRRGAV